MSPRGTKKIDVSLRDSRKWFILPVLSLHVLIGCVESSTPPTGDADVDDSGMNDGDVDGGAAEVCIKLDPETRSAEHDIDVTVALRSADVYFLSETARQTGAVGLDGAPLVQSISSNGSGYSDELVNVIEALARETPLDVGAFALDLPGDDIDASALIERIEPLHGDPASGVTSIESDMFRGVTPGTSLTFRLHVNGDTIPAPDTTQVVPAVVGFRAGEVALIEELLIRIEVPGFDGVEVCP